MGFKTLMGHVLAIMDNSNHDINKLNFLEDKVSYSFLSPLIPNADVIDTIGFLSKSLSPLPIETQLC